MRSLTAKLTLAFLLVGITGALLVALFVSLRTQSDFDRFLLDNIQADLVTELSAYYQEHGSWDGIGTIMMRERYRRPGEPEYSEAPVVLVDADRVVVEDGPSYELGQQLTRRQASKGIDVEVDGKVVGSVLLDPVVSQNRAPSRSPEADFLGRFRIAVLLSAVGAGAIALLLGILLARTISKPVQELTEATHRVAQGELGLQVAVRTEDELGELATSFNRMSADLAQATQQRRQMTADIAHELRTPLSVILGYTEALSDGKLPGTSQIYTAMHGEAQLLSHLIDDLRTLSLADAGELTLNRQRCRPQALLERTATAHAELARQKGVDLRVEAAAKLPDIEVDPERMAQVLGNLVTNALRYTPAGGQVVLSGEQQGDDVLLHVRDTGAGITPEDLPHIFDRFYRGDKARPQEEGESGLGLAIAKSIVEAHGGAIGVESTAGQGTTFSIALRTLPSA